MERVKRVRSKSRTRGTKADVEELMSGYILKYVPLLLARDKRVRSKSRTGERNADVEKLMPRYIQKPRPSP